MRDNRPTPQEIVEALYDMGFRDEIVISSVFFMSDNAMLIIQRYREVSEDA